MDEINSLMLARKERKGKLEKSKRSKKCILKGKIFYERQGHWFNFF